MADSDFDSSANNDSRVNHDSRIRVNPQIGEKSPVKTEHSSGAIAAMEKKLRRMLLFQRLGAGVLLLSLLGAVGWGVKIWLLPGSDSLPDIAVADHLNEGSASYWKDLTQWNIDEVRKLALSEVEIDNYHRLNTMKTIAKSQQLDLPFARNQALFDIALTLYENNIDVNIDDKLRAMEETEAAPAQRARVYVSQALLQLRLKNKQAARVAMMEYDRLLISADLKLETPINEMSFIGAVSVYSILQNIDSLNDLFKKQVAYTARILPDRRMRAYRIIAGEQARIQYGRQAIETLRKLDDAVERARACQLIIENIARPQEIQPVEPSMQVPRTEGPWPPLPNESIARNIVNEILHYIANLETLEEQTDTLIRIANSRLMCDPEIYKLVLKSVEHSDDLSDIVKRPALRALNDPESEIVRASLGLGEKVQTAHRDHDPALDDWNTAYGAFAVGSTAYNAEELRLFSDNQTFRALSMMSQSYLTVSRRSDAARVLRKAYEVARNLTHPEDRIFRLLTVADQQINAGDMQGARQSLLDVGLPSPSASEQENALFTEQRLSELARLQTVARFFDDARKTIALNPFDVSRSDDYAFLARDLLRVNRLNDVMSILETMPKGVAKTEIETSLQIARAPRFEAVVDQFAALNIPYPPSIRNDAERMRCCNLLIRKGLIETARSVAGQIGDTPSKIKVLSRIAREYIQLFNAYRADLPLHREVRAQMLNGGIEIAESLADEYAKVSLLEEIVSGAATYAKEDVELRKQLLEMIDRQISDNAPWMVSKNQEPDVLVDLLSRLMKSKLTLERYRLRSQNQRDDDWPLVEKERAPELYQMLNSRLELAIQWINESELTVRYGQALANLAGFAGQIGRIPAALQLLKAAEEAANELPDKSDCLTILLALTPTMERLESQDKLRSAFHRAFMLASETFDPATDGEPILQWRYRDMELDRVVRAQIQQGFLADAAGFTTLINDSMIRDRLLRSIAYIYLEQGKIPEAEGVVRRINQESFRIDTNRDIQFFKRRQPK